MPSPPKIVESKPEEPPRALSGHAACRFYVEIGNNQGSPIQAVFTEVSGLQVEMQVTEYEEGGTNSFVHRLPGRLKISNVTLKHGLTRSKDFLNWCLTPATRPKPSVDRRNVSVVMFDVAGQEVIRWNFAGAFPVKWVGPQFTADSTSMAIESLELAHQGMNIDTKAQGPAQTSSSAAVPVAPAAAGASARDG